MAPKRPKRHDRIDVYLGEDLRSRLDAAAAAAQKPPSTYLRDLLIRELHTQPLVGGDAGVLAQLRRQVMAVISTIDGELARWSAEGGKDAREEIPASGFRYVQIEPSALRAPSLRSEAAPVGRHAEAYQITIWGEDGTPDPDLAEALYLPAERRLGIAWEGPASWARVADLESGIAMWLNDPDAWEASI
jgi:hypothetical protein